MFKVVDTLIYGSRGSLLYLKKTVGGRNRMQSGGISKAASGYPNSDTCIILHLYMTQQVPMGQRCLAASLLRRASARSLWSTVCWVGLRSPGSGGLQNSQAGTSMTLSLRCLRFLFFVFSSSFCAYFHTLSNSTWISTWFNRPPFHPRCTHSYWKDTPSGPHDLTVSQLDRIRTGSLLTANVT